MNVRCPNCQKVNRLTGDWANKKITCGSCQHPLKDAEIVLPGQPDAPDAPDAPKQSHAGALAVALVTVLLVIGTFIWPTRYERGEFRGYPMRTDRFSGQVEILVPYGRGWVLVTRADSLQR